MKLILFFILLFVAAGCSEKEVKAKQPTAIPKTNEKPDRNEDALKFWQLVTQGKVANVTEFANSLVQENSGKVDEYYQSLFKEAGVKESFLARRDFNEVDAFFWSQAQLYKSLTREVVNSPKEPVQALYEMVVAKILSRSEVKDVSSYPFHIWQRGFGGGDRQSWVMCELVYQLGGNASIIYLIDPETKTSPHTICEVFYNGKHYIVDIMNKKFLEDTKFTDLTEDKIKEVWSGLPELHNSFVKAVRLIPSMPIDYTERNQRLNARLGKVIRFGEPPQNRFHFWKKLYPKMDIRLWDYSLRILNNVKFFKDAEK